MWKQRAVLIVAVAACGACAPGDLLDEDDGSEERAASPAQGPDDVTGPSPSAEQEPDADLDDGADAADAGGATPPSGGDSKVDGGSTALPESACGVGYSALGNSVSNSMCVRTRAGGAACSDGGNEKLVTITDSAGVTLTDVRYATGSTNWQGALVVRGNGALYESQGTKLKSEPLIAQGVISASAGYQHACALIEGAQGLDVQCWRAGSTSVARPALPQGMVIRQLSVTYDFACVLDDRGAVFCWASGAQSGNFGDIREQPQKLSLDGPMRFIAAGQREVCGIREDGALRCMGNFAGGQFYSVPLLADATFDASVYSDLRSVHLGQAQGCFILADGSAECRGQEMGQKGREGAPIPFAGAQDVIAAAGNKGQACVLTRDGALYCLRKENGSAQRAVLADGSFVQAEAFPCPL